VIWSARVTGLTGSRPFRVTVPLVAALVSVAAALAVVLLRPATVFAVMVIVGGVYLGSRWPTIAVAAIALSVPLQRWVLIGIEGNSTTVTKYILWSSVAGWLWSVVRRRSNLAFDGVAMALGVIVCALIASGWNAPNHGLWIGEVYRWAATFVVAVFAYSIYRSESSAVPFALASALGALGCAGVAAWQVYAQIGPESFETRGLMRAFGPFGHPNQLAIYLELTTPLMVTLSIAWWRGRRSSRPDSAFDRLGLLWVLAGMSGIGAMLASQSRGGGVGMAAGLVTSVGLMFVNLAPILLPIVVASTILGIVAMAIGAFWISDGALAGAARSAEVTVVNFAVEERLAHWAAGVAMAERHPWLGIGAGNFDEVFREVTTTWRFRIPRGHAHNSYLHMLAQAGIAGFVSYAILLGVVARRSAIALASSRNRWEYALVCGTAGASVAMTAHAVFEYVHVLSLNLHLAIAWGFTAAVASRGLGARRTLTEVNGH
jgi:putative inorganic carbon (hco3(-)) transporter